MKLKLIGKILTAIFNLIKKLNKLLYVRELHLLKDSLRSLDEDISVKNNKII